jgi:hypothetical protein
MAIAAPPRDTKYTPIATSQRLSQITARGVRRITRATPTNPNASEVNPPMPPSARAPRIWRGSALEVQLLESLIPGAGVPHLSMRYPGPDGGRPNLAAML